MDDLKPRAQEAPLLATGVNLNSATRTVSNSLIRNGSNSGNLMRASDLDLRQTKNELFSKLIERKQPQQMISMPSGQATMPTPNGTTSDENLNLSSLKKSTTNCSIADVDQQQLATKYGPNQQQKSAAAAPLQSETATTTAAAAAAAATTRQQFASLFTGKLEPASFSRQRSKWYTNEEVASILTSYLDHPEWQSNELQIRPKSGAVLLYSREKVRYRQDGYCWKKRKNGRTTREDHMKLKVQGVECIYGCYVHSALLPTFHRRCYWLLENPDIVLVHYLNQPPDDKKMILTFNSNLLELDTKRRWTNEEIVEEIGAVFGGISQIHRTLSINFPVANRVVASQSAVPLLATGDDTVQRGAANQADVGMTIADRQANEAEDDDRELRDNDGDNDDDEEMIVINGDCKGDNNRARRRRHSAGTSSSKTPGASDRDTNNPMIFDIVIDRRQQLGSDHNLHNIQQGPAFDLDAQPNEDQQQQINQQQNYQMAQKLDSKSCRDGQQVKPNPDEQAGPCSPVTQIYNKIVDDIETYAIPFKLNQFEPSHNHLQQQQHHFHDPTGVQSMDTSEPPDQNQSHCPTEMASRQLIEPQQQHQQHRHSYSAEPPLNPSSTHHHQELGCNGGVQQLIACDLFASCGHLSNDQNNNSANSDRVANGSDMLLSQFELGRNDVAGSDEHDNGESGQGNSRTRDESDEMRDLMMDNAELPLGDETHQAGGLLLACHTDHSDPLESLFSFKPLMSDSLKADHHQNQNLLDVKSTTSETDTLLSRLSPGLAGRQPPRCNSSDDAMQLSAQRLDQYLHHTSISFLAGAGPQDQMDAGFAVDGEQVDEASGNHQLLVDAFERFDEHHNMSAVGLSGEIQNSATSTEPSNSTSTSSLLNVTGGGHAGSGGGRGGGYLSNQSATEPGPSSSSTGSNYNEPNSTASSYIKLPLQQRQNSEQREPSNSVISSLLPKAFSLDGSDLSTVSNRNAKTTNQDHLQHQHHQRNDQHQYHQLHQRLSPLVGVYHHHHTTTRVGSSISPSARSGGAYGHQQPQQMLIVPSSATMLGSHHHQSSHLNDRHHYQRPSAPSISSYPQDGMQKLATTQCYSHLQSSAGPSPSQQQHSDLVGSGMLDVRARLLPILDYVPNWSPSSGGIKVLLIGCWASLTGSGGNLEQSETCGQRADTEEKSAEFNQSGGYSILFDELVVPASLIQDNVLRCYSPQREPGFIALKVLYKNVIVSEQVLFEIRPAESGQDQTTTMTSSPAATQVASSRTTVAQLQDQTAA